MRQSLFHAGIIMALSQPAGATEAAFAAWLQDFRPRALAAGIDAATLDATLPGLTYLPAVIDRDRRQEEFTKPIWDYLDIAVSDDRIARGRKAMAARAATLQAIETRFGVDAAVVSAIWGLESAYGGYRGDTPTLSALATLAHEGRRAAFFETELIAALRILQAGQATPDALRGSWAGAMGHTQFMPSSYLALAVDFDGDGRRDIWGDDPTDALASAAAYLAHHGWQKGQPWGLEVRLPRDFDYRQSGERVVKSPAAWAALGVAPAAGGALPDHGPAVLRLPAGHRGPAFLTFANFRVIERYNPADAYVIAIGHLADRLHGGPPFAAPWPRDDRSLSAEERRELQRRLTAAGFDTQGIDGRIGPNTLAAIQSFQSARGLVPDGYASGALLDRLR
jgi:lytic murein transglycosylase